MKNSGKLHHGLAKNYSIFDENFICIAASAGDLQYFNIKMNYSMSQKCTHTGDFARFSHIWVTVGLNCVYIITKELTTAYRLRLILQIKAPVIITVTSIIQSIP